MKKVYGYAIQTLNKGSEVPDVIVRVFASYVKLDAALEDLDLTDDQEISTFETVIE
jgi:hypothetical protein